MTRADLLAAWHAHLSQGRRRSDHTVRAYGTTAARLLDAVAVDRQEMAIFNRARQSSV